MGFMRRRNSGSCYAYDCGISANIKLNIDKPRCYGANFTIIAAAETWLDSLKEYTASLADDGIMVAVA
jgi:hypothetical protein